MSSNTTLHAALSEAMGQQKGTQIVEVEQNFYDRLIKVALNSLSSATLGTIREQLVDELERADTIGKLVDISMEFVETRLFVDKVAEEGEALAKRVGEQ
jgi:hypothetical protein